MSSVDFSTRHMRPAKGYFSPEAGLVASALKSFGLMNDRFDVLLMTCHPDQWGATSRIDSNHADNFAVSSSVWNNRSDEEAKNLILHAFAKSAMRALMQIAAGRMLIFPGRDVWIFHVLARKFRYQSLYDPRISRYVAANKAALRDAVVSWGIIDFEETFVFDTGFAGSIANAMRRVIGPQFKDLMLSTHRKREEDGYPSSLQIFPNHKGARAKALDIEYLPKYFRTGTVEGGNAVQYYSDLPTFLKAVAMTIWWWHARSPRFVTRPEPEPDLESQKVNIGVQEVGTVGNPATVKWQYDPAWDASASSVTFATTDTTLTLPIAGATSGSAATSGYVTYQMDSTTDNTTGWTTQYW